MTHHRPSGGSAVNRREPLHWGAFEICSSCGYILLTLLLIAAVAAGVLALIDFGSLEQMYGFNQLAT